MRPFHRYTDMRAVIGYAKASTLYFHLLTTLVMLGRPQHVHDQRQRAHTIV